METFVVQYITAFTYFGIFTFLMLTVFGFPFPEDAVLLLSGAVASQGITAVWPTLSIAYSGVIVGDFILYFIGRRYGKRIVHHEKFGRLLPPARLKKVGAWFHKWGNSLIFFGRHLVGFRAQILLCAGVFRLPFKRVLIYDAASALISVPLMVGLGYLFGKNIPYIRKMAATGHWVLTGGVLAALALWAVYYIYKKKRA